MSIDNTSASTKICPTCGTRVVEDASRCLVCGTNLGDSVKTSKPEKAVQGSRMPQISLSLPVVLGIFALLIIIGCYTVFTLFTFITLPVEFDASKRALQWIDERGITTSQEQDMAKDALKWAALTYVVAALGSLVTLLYYISILLGRD